jgi:hypothetical protein
VNSDPRLVARPNDAADIRVDPANADVVYVPTIVTWKSSDGGRTFAAFRGAPGGDDYQKIWINPGQPDVMILTADQGAIVTLNGGATWSSWYNQPTAQFYHVSTDNAFPYRVCGGQQDSGSACVASRGDQGQITFRDWSPVGVEEYGYVAPDPLDPDIVYGGRVSRFDRRKRAGSASRTAEARRLSRASHSAADVLSHRPADVALCFEHSLEVVKRRDELDGDFSRPDTRCLGTAAISRRVSRARHRAFHAPRRDLCRRTLSDRRQGDLGRGPTTA